MASFFLQIDKFTLDNDNDLFYGLKVAGTSLGIVTEFLYKIYEEAGGTFCKFLGSKLDARKENLEQSGWSGCRTGNREKLSNSQVCCLAQLCLAVA